MRNLMKPIASMLALGNKKEVEKQLIRNNNEAPEIIKTYLT